MGQRIRQRRKELGLTGEDVVTRMEALRRAATEAHPYFGANGLKRAGLSMLEAGKNGTTTHNLHLIAAALHTTADYLLGIDAPPPHVPVDSNAFVVRDFDVAYRKFVPVRARATFAETFDDQRHEELPEFPVVLFNGETIPEHALVVEVNGDSMEPTLRTGWKVLIEPINQADWLYARPGILAVLYRAHFVIKRVRRNTLRETKTLLLESDNPDGGSETVLGDDLRMLWRVRRVVDAPIDLH
ncbi:hypothetical protein GCM10023186_42360 [Hymenobacter koreensis]|uniref:HTH cro/C1-type domain-containing protein n=2 Tax=Hymenobacter koreensis TaxID=1084523 RepID=A0ABP8JK69_9BACT